MPYIVFRLRKMPSKYKMQIGSWRYVEYNEEKLNNYLDERDLVQ